MAITEIYCRLPISIHRANSVCVCVSVSVWLMSEWQRQCVSKWKRKVYEWCRLVPLFARLYVVCVWSLHSITYNLGVVLPQKIHPCESFEQSGTIQTHTHKTNVRLICYNILHYNILFPFPPKCIYCFGTICTYFLELLVGWLVSWLVSWLVDKCWQRTRIGNGVPHCPRPDKWPCMNIHTCHNRIAQKHVWNKTETNKNNVN